MKTVARKKNYWQYLFWLGLVLAIAGVSAGVLSERWQPLPLALLISGIVIIGVSLLFQARESRWWGRRSTQAGTNALIATLSVLVILGVVNFLGVRYSQRVDYTETGLYTLAPQSRSLARNLSQPVKVWIFDRIQNPQDRELLENYRRQNPLFGFEYIDPQAQPGLQEKFGVKQFGEVYLEAGKQRQLVQVVNEQQRLSEVQLTNKLQQIISDRTAKVYFLQGHGENPISPGQGGLSQAISALGNQGYTAQPLNLVQQPTIPEDAAAIVVAGAKRQLFDQEVQALSNYLNGGGSLLLMLEPDTDPGLNTLLSSWGIDANNLLVIDPSGTALGLGPAVPVVTEYGQHPITQDFANGISFYRGARPIESTPVAGVQIAPLLLTSPESWAESQLNSEELEFNPESDRPGPLTIGVALSRQVKTSSTPQQSPTKPSSSPTISPQPSPTTSPTPAEKSDNQPQTAKLVVIGDAEFATDGFFEQQLNGDVFLNSVSWLSDQDQQLLSIRPKEAKNRRINLTPQQVNSLSLISVLIVPLLGFMTAIILWWLRR